MEVLSLPIFAGGSSVGEGGGLILKDKVGDLTSYPAFARFNGS
jgi:hypothetical protein